MTKGDRSAGGSRPNRRPRLSDDDTAVWEADQTEQLARWNQVEELRKARAQRAAPSGGGQARQAREEKRAREEKAKQLAREQAAQAAAERITRERAAARAEREAVAAEAVRGAAAARARGQEQVALAIERAQRARERGWTTAPRY